MGTAVKNGEVVYVTMKIEWRHEREGTYPLKEEAASFDVPAEARAAFAVFQRALTDLAQGTIELKVPE
jgi:hypothetical protein